MNAVSLGGPKVLNEFIGEAYFHLHEWDSALIYIHRAYDLDVRDTNSHWSVPYQYLAALYDEKGNRPRALDLYRESLALSTNNNDKLKTYNGLASVYIKIGQTDSAVFYARQVISQGTAVSIPAPVIEASALLAKIYKSIHNTDSAFKYQEILLASKDSLFSQEKIKQMQNVTFDEQLRQQEISTEKEKYRNRVKLYTLVAALAVSSLWVLYSGETIEISKGQMLCLARKIEKLKMLYADSKIPKPNLFNRKRWLLSAN
jgi:tetratricopeptide (TPR) repeat protein